jgi:mono/diheme cytochrome c family protein
MMGVWISPVVLLTLLSVSWAEDPGPAFNNPSRFTEQSGDEIYRWICAGCHMPDGHGATGAGTYPSLHDDSRLAAANYPIGVVLNGQKGMPSFGRALSDEQVAAVVNYVRTHFGNRFDEPATLSGVAAAR